MRCFSARRALIALILAVCLSAANPAWAVPDHASPGAPSAAAMAIDVAVIRPVTFAVTVVGAGLFFVSLPFSLAGMNVNDSAQRLIGEPGAYTFVRPLGNFEAQRPGTDNYNSN